MWAMKKRILNSYNELTIYDKLKKIETNLIKINLLIESIENEKMGEKETANFIRRFFEQKNLKRIEVRISRFLRFPLQEPKTGRPVEFPDSGQEKRRYKSFRLQGLSVRQIAKKEKTSPATVCRKLKAYKID